MAQQPNNRAEAPRITLSTGEAIAVAVSVIWVLFVVVFFGLRPGEDAGPTHRLLVLLATIGPLMLIWIGAAIMRLVHVFQSEMLDIHMAIDGLRQMQHAQQAMGVAPEPAVEKQLTEIAETARKTEATVSRFASRREVSRLIVPRAAPHATSEQPALALGTAAEELNPPLARPDLIKALNFPDDENDADGFSALRRALLDRTARRLVQASQDVLTLLSQDGIYMDDLRADPVGADVWRRFANGERGQAVAPLGAVRDRSSLALASGRLREDTIFRDALHHFLRRFDQMLVTFEAHATDTDLLELAETRTARAFMLLGSVTGTFD